MGTLKIHGKTGQLGDLDRNELLNQLKGKTAYSCEELKRFTTQDLKKLQEAVNNKRLQNVGFYGIQANTGKPQVSKSLRTMLGVKETTSKLSTYGGNLSTNEAQELENLKEWDASPTLTPASVLQRRRELERKAKGTKQVLTNESKQKSSESLRKMAMK